MVSTHRSQLSLRRGGKQRPGPLVVNGANNRLQTSLGKPSITRRELFPALPKGTLGTLLRDFGPRLRTLAGCRRRAGNCRFAYPQAHRREHRAFGRLDNLALRVRGMASRFALTWLDIEALREPCASGQSRV